MTQFIDQNLKFIQEQWDTMDFRWIKQANCWGCKLWDQDRGKIYFGQGDTIELAYYDADPRTITGKNARENLKRVLENMARHDNVENN